MKQRTILSTALIVILALFISLSGWSAKPVYATYGSITVYKKDTKDNKLKNWKFKLYVWNSGKWSYHSERTTDTNGKAYWSSVNYAYYMVCEEIKAGWTPQSPTDENGCQGQFQIKSGQSSKTLTFVNKEEPQTRNIRVFKKDQSGNYLSGWAFTAKNTSSGTTYGPVSTNGNGEAVFYNLPLGTYKVCEESRSGWVPIDPSNGCAYITLTTETTTSMSEVADDAAVQTGGSHGSTSNKLTFKNLYQVGKIKVYKKNQHGTGLKGWKIIATHKTTGAKYEATTNSSGWAFIYNLPFGTYNVCEVLQDGWVPVDGYSLCYSVKVDKVAYASAADTQEDTADTQEDVANTQEYLEGQTSGGSDYKTVTFKNRPANPGIKITKYTQGGDKPVFPGADANSNTGDGVPRIKPGDPVIWNYIVENTGEVPFAKDKVVVTDNRKDIPAKDSVLPKYISGDDNTNNLLDPGEKWVYQATGTALDLSKQQGKHIVDGCLTGSGIPLATYNNVGKVKVTGTTLEKTDPSHYCNPPVPGISIKKLTNGADANNPNGDDVPKIAPNDAIKWTYEVKNTGNVPFAKDKVVVTDNRQNIPAPGSVVPEYVSGDANENDLLDPGETWIYEATGQALNLPAETGDHVTAGCAVGDLTTRPTYNNTGTVTVTGTDLTASDPSHYCNPDGPGITIKKYTNGADADNPNGDDVPQVSPTGFIEWTYVVENTGNVSFAKTAVVVTDNRQDIPDKDSVVPVYVSGDGNSNNYLDPGEKWLYVASGNALNLATQSGDHIVTGCGAGEQTARPTYNNTGTVTVTGTDLTASDPSHYCNPPATPELAALGDRVWYDTNANGVQDNGEVGVPGVTVNLLLGDCTTATGQSTTTNGSGIYGFTNLAPGNYCVHFDLSTLPAGFVVSPQDVGDDSKDSDGHPSSGKTTSVTLAGGETNLTLDLGIYQPASLGDYVWEDKDRDGEQDGDEPPVAGVTVTLYTCADVQVGDPVVTDEQGAYRFDNLMPGCYYVVFSNLPEDYRFTTPKQSGVDEALDSDADASGKTPSVTLVSGQHYPHLDAGLVVRTLEIVATPLCEQDAPKLQYSVQAINFTPGENSLTIRWRALATNEVLYEATNQPLNGTVLWPEVGLDEHGVANQWPGWSFENGQWVDKGSLLRPQVVVEFDVNPTDAVTVAYPPATPNCSPGPRASLGNRVWIDELENGQQDADEPNVPGVKVTLYTCEGEQVGDPTFTNENGEYLFDNLVPGCYYVVFDPTTLPEGFSFTAPNEPGVDEALDSDADPASGQTPDVTIQPGEVYLDLDAGVVPAPPPPTNLPASEQPAQRVQVYLPSVQTVE